MYALSQLFGTMWSCANDTQAAAWEGRDCNAFKIPPQPLLLLLSCHLCVCLGRDPSPWHAPRNPCTLIIPSSLDYIHWTQVGSPPHRWDIGLQHTQVVSLPKPAIADAIWLRRCSFWTMRSRKLWATSLHSLDTQTQKSMFYCWRLIHWCGSLCQTQY